MFKEDIGVKSNPSSRFRAKNTVKPVKFKHVSIAESCLTEKQFMITREGINTIQVHNLRWKPL